MRESCVCVCVCVGGVRSCCGFRIVCGVFENGKKRKKKKEEDKRKYKIRILNITLRRLRIVVHAPIIIAVSPARYGYLRRNIDKDTEQRKMEFALCEWFYVYRHCAWLLPSVCV